jgi:cation diffusion facilitator family transporter
MLTARAQIGRASRLADPDDRRTTPTTGLSLPIVDVESRSLPYARIAPTRGAPDHGANGCQELPGLRKIQRRRGESRIDPRPPKRLRRVDVPETGDEALVEQHDFDRDAASLQRCEQSRWSETWIFWLRTEIQRHHRCRRVYIDCRQCSRIVEHGPRPVRKLEHRPGKAWKRIGRLADHPITVHAKVHVNDSSVVEMDELVLTASFDIPHPCSVQRAKHAGGNASPERSMQEPHALDGSTANGKPQCPDSSLYLRQFGHAARSNGGLLTGVIGARQLDTMTVRAQPTADYNVHDARSPAVRRVLAQVLALNALVVLVKLVIGVRTGSLSVLGAALESGLDTLNNVIGMLLVTVAARAPDEEHPYGHDKFETLGALGIVGFLSISCFELLREGVSALVRGGAQTHTRSADLGIVGATLLVNFFVVWYERRRGSQIGSIFLLADAEHTRGDILVTLLAVVSLVLGRHGGRRVDAVLAIAVALIIAFSGWRILRRSIPILVDERAIEANELRDIVARIPGVLEVRGIRSRYTASGILFAELTIAVDGSTPVDVAHGLADHVEEAIARRYGSAEITVHVEPA